MIVRRKTETIVKRYNRIANIYDKLNKLYSSATGNKGSHNDFREIVWDLAKGNVLEVGVGTGNNIQYYTNDINITSVDFSNNMLDIAKEKAQALGKSNIDFKVMDVQNLDFPDNKFDTVVCTFIFQSVPNPIKGLSEMNRVCAPNGTIIMLEHVKSNKFFTKLIANILSPIDYMLVGCTLNRDTVQCIKDAGLKIESIQNLKSDVVKLIVCRK